MSSSEVSALRVNKIVQHNTKIVLDGLKDDYSNLAKNLLKNLLKTSNKFTLILSFSITKVYTK